MTLWLISGPFITPPHQLSDRDRFSLLPYIDALTHSDFTSVPKQHPFIPLFHADPCKIKVQIPIQISSHIGSWMKEWLLKNQTWTLWTHYVPVRRSWSARASLVCGWKWKDTVGRWMAQLNRWEQRAERCMALHMESDGMTDEWIKEKCWNLRLRYSVKAERK